MHRTVYLIFALLAASGFWIASHWDEARLYLGLDKPAEVLAVRLVQGECSLERLRTNHEVIEDFVASVEGIEAIGWRAEPRGKGGFRVKFEYTLDGVDDAYAFDVNMDSRTVVYVDDERDYADRFGPRARPR